MMSSARRRRTEFSCKPKPCCDRWRSSAEDFLAGRSLRLLRRSSLEALLKNITAVISDGMSISGLTSSVTRPVPLKLGQPCLRNFGKSITAKASLTPATRFENSKSRAPFISGQQILKGRTGPCNRQNSEQKIAASSDSVGGGDDVQKEAYGLRRISWISFWLQLALSVVSAIVLFFTATTASQGAFPQAPVFFNLGGVVLGFISTFLAYSRTRVARRVIEASEKVSKSKLAADVLGVTRLNLFGLGLTLVGLQSTVGGLVGKALTSSSAGAYNVQSAQNAPAALDVFAVQASTNTILLHFLGIVFANWTLRVLNKDAKSPAPA